MHGQQAGRPGRQPGLASDTVLPYRGPCAPAKGTALCAGHATTRRVGTAEVWNWEQGRLDYFQFDELRKIARFGAVHDLRTATRSDLEDAVGLPFLPDNAAYRPWRNYGRLFQIAMIAVPDSSDGAKLTELGRLLADDGKVTADEYLHFLAQATTQPSPALSGWDHTQTLRFPLLFALRFVLARTTLHEPVTDIIDIIKSYHSTGFRGDESQEAILPVLDMHTNRPLNRMDARQASESVKVLAQLSYLSANRNQITVSLTPSDAAGLLNHLKPIRGTTLAAGADEIDRRAALFANAQANNTTSYPRTVLSDVREAGFDAAFPEGGRVRRAHLSIERNHLIRDMFFKQQPGHACDFCGMDTRQVYPWTDRLLEVHHLLPLCSGVRTSNDGTLLEDLVANCPSCHRAVHRYYDEWLVQERRVDFADAREAREVYVLAKRAHHRAARHPHLA